MNRPVLVVSNDDIEIALSYEAQMEDLRGVVWNAFVREGRTLEDIAVVANLHFLTVEKFAWGETKRPAFRTVFQLAMAVGFRAPFIPSNAPRQPDEASLHWARTQIPAGSRR